MISLIMTVKNERHHLPRWLADMQAQTREPDEIVIVDGGSTDGTWEWLQKLVVSNLRVFQAPGSIAAGRNYAIGAAKGDVIVATDAGCSYGPTWLAEITAPILSGQTEFVATAFGPWLEPNDPFLLFLLAGATTPRPREFTKDWLPSSRSSAFTRKLWERVGKYPEWLPYTEDVMFDLNVKKQGVHISFIRQPLVFWRPRTSCRAYLRQLANYTRGDGLAKLFYGRQFIRFAVYAGAIFGLVFTFMQSLWWLLPLIAGGCAYMKKFWQRFLEFSRVKSLPVRILGICLLPIIVALGDVAKMWGWLTGVGERWKMGNKMFPPFL